MQQEVPTATAEITLDAVAAQGVPLIFISHDSRDSQLAEAFENLLTGASGGMLKAFRSSDQKGTSGIEYGAEWYRTIMDRLNEASCVVALLTDHSVGRPWILYEAGVAKGRLNATVFGVAVGVSLEQANAGPFGQFQNCGDDEDALTKLVLQLITQVQPGATPQDRAVRLHVNEFRQEMEKAVAGSTSKPPAPRVDIATVARMVEEVKLAVQDLSEIRGSTRRSRSFHPGMVEELLFTAEEPEEVRAAWLTIFSLLRDDYPWLHELGMEAYPEVMSGNPEREQRGVNRLIRTIRQIGNSRVGFELMEDRDGYRLLRYLPDMLEHWVDRRRMREAPPRRRRPQSKPSGAAAEKTN